jgi:hypothetical protein
MVTRKQEYAVFMSSTNLYYSANPVIFFLTDVKRLSY